jgi:hypothetical protein
MDCRKIHRHLNDYADGLLDRGLKAAVDEHLADCPGCRERLDELLALRAELENLSRAFAPPDFLQRVHRQLEEEKAPRTRMRGAPGRLVAPRWVRAHLPVGLAALATAVVALIFVLNIMIPESGRRLSTGERELPESIATAEAPEEFDGEAPRIVEEYRAEPEEPPKTESKFLEKASDEDVPPVDVASDEGLVTAPLEITLILRTESLRAKESRVSSREAARLEKRDTGALSLTEADTGTVSPSPDEEPSGAGAGVEGQPQPEGETHLLAVLEELTIGLGGRVLSVDPADASGRPRSVTVEIPIVMLDRFFVALSDLGETVYEDLPPAPDPGQTGEELLPVRIVIGTPESP